jgi:hypothetical protein
LKKVWAWLFVLSLGLAACEGRLDPKLVQGEYQAQMASIKLDLRLLPDDQAVLIKDPGKGKAASQFGLWNLSGNKLTVTFFKPDPYRGGGEHLEKNSISKMVEGTLVLTVKRSTRTLWLDGTEFKKL